MAIFTHVTVGTNDLSRARSFYDRVLGALGYKRLQDLGESGSIWGESAPEFFVLKPANGLPATWGNGGAVSFVAPSRAAVAKFHKEALALGAKDEGAWARAAGIRLRTRATCAISTATRSARTASRGNSAYNPAVSTHIVGRSRSTPLETKR
jgi:catechol 2,3-dioxygenase-like lactoylglutathione lyase family enzyme